MDGEMNMRHRKCPVYLEKIRKRKGTPDEPPLMELHEIKVSCLLWCPSCGNEVTATMKRKGGD
jgi:hypothetical protein